MGHMRLARDRHPIAAIESPASSSAVVQANGAAWPVRLASCYGVTVVTKNARQLLLLLYKVPSEPTANRVSVWRKLKRLGAILLHDSVWVLPPSPRTIEEL